MLGGDLAAVLALGDTQYEEATLNQFLLSYDLSWGRVKSITRPAIGNHEYRVGPSGETPTEGYYDYFKGVGEPTGPAGDRDKGYYSFDVGDWHVIALNSVCDQVAGGCGPGSAQEQWLRDDLAANSDASCTVAYWHHPLFNSGPEGSYDDTPWNTTPLWQALYDWGADLVLAGHSHAYERFAPQDALGNRDLQYGLREFIVGTGGKSLGNNGEIQPNSEVRDNTQYGVIKLALHPTSYDWKFVNDSGETRDTGSQTCHGDPPPDTSIASGPSGKINTTSVSLSFASSEPDSTFSCKLDGPGSSLGSETSCSSPQAYSGLANGTYTFSVSAIDGRGNPDSTPATRSFTVDTVPPNTSITSTAVKKNSATFKFSSSEAGSTFACKLDAGAWASCTSPTNYSGLTAGSHTFAVYAIDAARNADPTPATKTFSIKSTTRSASTRLALVAPAIR